MVSTPEVKCYLCGGLSHHRRPGRVRDAADMKILECDGCGLVFLSRNRLAGDFYQQSGMHGDNPQPVDSWLRETERDDERRYRYLNTTMTNRDVMDFGCGAGGFLLKARTAAKRVVGIELEERLQPYYREQGLQVVRDAGDIPADVCFDLITAFHVIEHLEDPAGMLRLLATKLRGGAKSSSKFRPRQMRCSRSMKAFRSPNLPTGVAISIYSMPLILACWQKWLG